MCTTCWDTAASTASMGTTAIAAGAATVATTVHGYVRRVTERGRDSQDADASAHDGG